MTLSEKRATAGKKGGLANAQNHNHQYFIDLGLSSVRARGIEPLIDRVQRLNAEKEEVELRGNSLKELRQFMRGKYQTPVNCFDSTEED